MKILMYGARDIFHLTENEYICIFLSDIWLSHGQFWAISIGQPQSFGISHWISTISTQTSTRFSNAVRYLNHAKHLIWFETGTFRN